MGPAADEDGPDLRLRDLPRMSPWWIKAMLWLWAAFVVTGVVLFAAALILRHH